MVLRPATMKTTLLDGIRQLILKSVSDVPGGSRSAQKAATTNQEFIIAYA